MKLFHRQWFDNLNDTVAVSLRLCNRQGKIHFSKEIEQNLGKLPHFWNTDNTKLFQRQSVRLSKLKVDIFNNSPAVCFYKNLIKYGVRRNPRTTGDRLPLTRCPNLVEVLLTRELTLSCQIGHMHKQERHRWVQVMDKLVDPFQKVGPGDGQDWGPLPGGGSGWWTS